jgi:hypothetical protein
MLLTSDLPMSCLRHSCTGSCQCVRQSLGPTDEYKCSHVCHASTQPSWKNVHKLMPETSCSHTLAQRYCSVDATADAAKTTT